MKNKLIKTRITVGALAIVTVVGGILGISSMKQSDTASDTPDTITAQITESVQKEPNAEEALSQVSANKNAPPIIPNIKNETDKKPEDMPENKDNSSVEATFDPYAEDSLDVMATDEFSLMWPLEGETLLAYSADRTIYDSTLDQYRTNNSLWIGASCGDIVRAAETGIVKACESLPTSGNTVTIEHDNGWRTTYGQLEALILNPGEEVDKGEIIGYVGKTTKYGSNQGDHLEFSVYVENESINPELAVES